MTSTSSALTKLPATSTWLVDAVAFLLDTNVVSEMRKSKPDPNVTAWFADNSAAMAYISVLVVGEIRRGIDLARVRDRGRAAALDSWLDQLVDTYQDRVLAVSIAAAEEWGRMLAVPQPPPIVDTLMAATAKAHRLTLVTRNVKDVARTGVPMVNPFEPRTAAQNQGSAGRPGHHTT
jgi:predicted nucleic acid-binding protein